MKDTSAMREEFELLELLATAIGCGAVAWRRDAIYGILNLGGGRPKRSSVDALCGLFDMAVNGHSAMPLPNTTPKEREYAEEDGEDTI